MKQLKRYLYSASLVVLACGVALLLAEGFVRYAYPYSRDHVVPGGLFDIDDYLGWKLAPGKSAVHHSRYFDATYTINALGYRDKPREQRKAPGTYRVLLYGDSQIFGWGVDVPERFSDLVEAQLPRLEIWNLAVPGYGLDQEILSYERRGAGFAADAVMFFASRATLDRLRYDYIYRKNKPKFVLDPSGDLQLIPLRPDSNTATKLLYRLLSPLYLPYFVDRRIALLKQSLQQSGAASETEDGADGVAFGALETAILRRAVAVAQQRGQRITIATDLRGTAAAAVEALCAQAGCDALRFALPEDDAPYRFGEHDGHWNPGAHRLIAAQLLGYLKARITASRQDD